MNDAFRQSTNEQTWRVKVYLLNQQGNWDDLGTGVFELVKEVKLEEEMEYLKVVATDDSSKTNSPQIDSEKQAKLKGDSTLDRCILYLPILQSNHYEKQSGKIILNFIQPFRLYNILV